jgi:hypothetical protein
MPAGRQPRSKAPKVLDDSVLRLPINKDRGREVLNYIANAIGIGGAGALPNVKAVCEAIKAVLEDAEKARVLQADTSKRFEGLFLKPGRASTRALEPGNNTSEKEKFGNSADKDKRDAEEAAVTKDIDITK